MFFVHLKLPVAVETKLYSLHRLMGFSPGVAIYIVVELSCFTGCLSSIPRMSR